MPPRTRATASPKSIKAVIPLGDLRSSLEAIRDRLADELDDLKWSKHKRECRCTCGITDPRSIVALTKRLEETITALAALPPSEKVVTAVDRIRADAAVKRDDLAARRAGRKAGGAAS